MKKIISMLIIFCLVMSSAAVFAETETTDTNTKGIDKKAVRVEKQAAKAQNAAEKQVAKTQKVALKQEAKAQKDAVKAELKAVKDQIKANRETINGLKTQVRDLHSKAKARIKEIVKDKENLNQETVDELKDLIAQLRDDRVGMAGTVGKVKEECLNMGMAKKNKDTEKIKEGLNNVLEVQKTRIDKLNGIIEALNKIIEYKAQ